MFSDFTAIAVLLGLVYPTIVAANPQACKKDACLREVIKGHKPGGRGACKAFFETTVAPYSTTTTTITSLITSSTTDVATETFQTTTLTASTLIVVSTEVDSLSPTTTTTAPPSPTGQAQQKLLERSQAPAVTYSSTAVPAYASKVCANVAMYSSACSCVGATHRTTTLPLRVKTKTVREPQTTISTISQTTTDATSISTAVSVTTVTSATTTTVESVATALCTQVTSAPDMYGETFTYANYYAGSGYEENTNNPGNGYEPPEYFNFDDLGPDNACDAIQRCANLGAPEPFFALSFDVHYFSSNASWGCVAYFLYNNDPSYFNVADPDITQAYGYSRFSVQ